MTMTTDNSTVTRDHAAMAELRNKVAGIADLIPRGKPVVFLDYPVYLNVGDLLIEKGTEAFFRAGGYRVLRSRSAYDFTAAQIAALDPDATIVFHGGGNFGDLYELHQKFRERVIAQCRHNRIVILPQTIHFASPQRMEECARLFATHPDLHVCVRDEISYDLFARHFSNSLYLFPDMAHFLWGWPLPKASRQSDDVLLFLRVDKEAGPLSSAFGSGQKPRDWCDLIGQAERVAFGLLYRLHRHHDRYLPNTEIHPLWRLLSEHMINKSRRLVSGYGGVVTDRLHMALLALLMGRRAEMVDNSYGKLSSYHACWLKTISRARMLRTLPAGRASDASTPIETMTLRTSG